MRVPAPIATLSWTALSQERYPGSPCDRMKVFITSLLAVVRPELGCCKPFVAGLTVELRGLQGACYTPLCLDGHATARPDRCPQRTCHVLEGQGPDPVCMAPQPTHAVEGPRRISQKEPDAVVHVSQRQQQPALQQCHRTCEACCSDQSCEEIIQYRTLPMWIVCGSRSDQLAKFEVLGIGWAGEALHAPVRLPW